MIREDLLEFKYYLNRLSMFMKESYGIKEHVEIFYRQLALVNEMYDELFENIDIHLFDRHEEGDKISFIIDKIGKIFGCQRNSTIYYYAPDDVQMTTKIYKEIKLNDSDLLTYIKCQIVKQNFQGTREELSEIYSTFENGAPTEGILPLQFVYHFVQSPGQFNSAQCQIYWSNYEEFSSNLQYLFQGGYLTIESMGISYHRVLKNVNNVSFFALAFNSIDPDNGDWFYDTASGKYYIWVSEDLGWVESDSQGPGNEMTTYDNDKNNAENFARYYYFSGKDKDYFKCTDDNKYYIWNAQSQDWVVQNSEPAEGHYWGEMEYIPLSLEGGFLG